MKLKNLQYITQKNSMEQRLNMVVISNVTFNPYFTLLINKAFISNSMSVNIIFIDYNEFLSGSFNASISGCDLIVVIPNFFELYPNLIYKSDINTEDVKEILDRDLSNMNRICSFIRAESQAQIIWFGYEDYSFTETSVVGNVMMLNGLVDKLNLFLSNNKAFSITFIDMKRLIANIGVSNAFDIKNKYRWNSPYGQTMIEEICNEIHKLYLAYNGITKKCVVLDCDNVLWGGIISEDGIENINLGSSGLGRPYQDFQRYLLFLYNHGVILTVCSKNDLSDIMVMFREHSGMVIRENNIACFQVNWDNKVDNIRKISETLNIGLDSMVFIDDSDFEIEFVKGSLPEVTAIKYERNAVYEQLSCFNLKNEVDSEKVYQRNMTYKTNRLRQQLKENSKSFDEYIESLDIKIDIHRALPIEYSRISELTQRTNKCTNGIRYTVEQLKQNVLNTNFKMYSVSVSDKFSNLGLVGAVIVYENTLMLFSLSCRVLGRKVEDDIFNVILNSHHIEKVLFKDTGKNNEMRDFFIKKISETIILV